MRHSLRIVLITLAGFAMNVSAEDILHSLPDIGGNNSDHYELLDVQPGMSHSEYRQAADHNRQMVGSYAINALQYKLNQIGVSENIVGFTATSAQIAIGHASFGLNSEKTFYLDLDDATDQDRAMSIKWKLSW